MADIKPVGSSAPTYTPEQKEALKRLHEASQQLEGVFLQMMMSAMRDTVPKDSIFGQQSAGETTWQDMLDNERTQAIAKQGSLGIARVLEEQLKAQVLGDAQHEAHVQVERRVDP